MDTNTRLLWEGPMKKKACTEFISVLEEYRHFVRETLLTELRTIRTDNDPCYTDLKFGPPRNVEELQRRQTQG
jgi:hypothetical protein